MPCHCAEAITPPPLYRQPLELRALGRFTRVGEAGVAVRSVRYEDVCLRACCLSFGVHCSAFQ